MRSIVMLISIVSIYLFSCTKFGKNVYVDGRVYNPITGEGIPNIPVKLYRGKIDWGDPLGTASKTLKTTTTDANGYYKLEHLSTPFNRVAIQLNTLDYYPIGWVDFGNQGEAGIKKGKKNHLDYQMVPYGYMKYTIKNTSCFDQTDTLVLNIKYQISNIKYQIFLIYQIILLYIQVVLNILVLCTQIVLWAGITLAVIIKRMVW